MKANIRVLAALAAIVIGGTIGCTRQTDLPAGDLVYKIETGGVLAGYAVLDTFLVREDGDQLIRLEQRSEFKAKLMGADVDNAGRLTFLMTPADKRVLSHAGESATGKNSASWSVACKDGQAFCSSSLKQDNMVLDLPPDVVVENTLFFDHVVDDLTGPPLNEKTYRVLDLADFEIRDTRYEKHATETLSLGRSEYEVLVVDRSVEATGILMRLWLDTATSMVVKILEQDGNVITLADPSVMRKIERVDMDKYLFDKTDVAIADVAGISYMKVRAKFRPIGLKPTPELLNVPGQKFTGTVVDNLVEGVFEIEHIPYDGTGAPAFPVVDNDPEFAEYLAADGIFESDDEILAAEAKGIVVGAADSWEAATRLARWVSDEISYAIPGGGTARNTYDIKAGECGAHSILLATFCRIVGIPARMVWGCMYTPNHGGSFGQHGWTEVHMGAAGWIPVDATVGETDFVDSGHIRVAHFGSLVSRLNAQEFEILDYRVTGGSTEATAAVAERYAAYLGHYRQTGSSQDSEVRVMDGCLVVDLPGQAMLALDEPDDQGRWVCKLATHVFMTFGQENGSDQDGVKAFTLHELYTLPHRAVPEVINDLVPTDFRPRLGAYHMAALAADFTVTWEHGGLALQHPRYDRAYRLTPGREDGTWQTENGPYTISFVTGQDGQVESLMLDSASEFRQK